LRSPGNPDHVVAAVGSDLHGREMINQAVERKRGLSVSEMVQAGAWYSERAGENVEGMLEEENWIELIKEDIADISHSS